LLVCIKSLDLHALMLSRIASYRLPQNLFVLKQPNQNSISQSLGYCFIDFRTPAIAASVFERYNNIPIQDQAGKAFRLNWASGSGVMDKRADRGPEYSVFVGDLSLDVTDEQLFVSISVFVNEAAIRAFALYSRCFMAV